MPVIFIISLIQENKNMFLYEKKIMFKKIIFCIGN
jgi:hypothetical protein